MNLTVRTHWLIAALLFLVVVITGANAREYVSLSGQFYLTYPDDWHQVDYKTVDQALAEMQAGRNLLDYDAVLAPQDSRPFHAGPYAIVSVDTSGEFSPDRIDSVLNELSSMFSKDARYFPIGDFMANLEADAPAYDEDAKIISVLNTITRQGKAFKKNLILFKFYEQGLVTLYCYAPDSLFDQAADAFVQMARTVSTENVEAHLPKEEVKVADLENRELPDDSNGGVNWWLAAVLVVAGILLLLVAVRLIKKQSTQS